jgi:hypothetical protein
LEDAKKIHPETTDFFEAGTSTLKLVRNDIMASTVLRIAGRKLETIVVGNATGSTTKVTKAANNEQHTATTMSERTLSSLRQSPPPAARGVESQSRPKPQAPSYMQTGYFRQEQQIFGEGF